MVITFDNLMVKGRIDKQTDKLAECSGIYIDYNSNQMSKSESSGSNVLHLDVDGSIEYKANGNTREFRRSYEGSGGKRSSGVLADGMDGRIAKRNSTSSKEYIKEKTNTQCNDDVNRESYCSIESDTASIGQTKPGYNDLQQATKVKSKQFKKFTKGLFTKGANSNSSGTSGKNLPSPDNVNFVDKLPQNGTKPKKGIINGQTAKKQDSKVRLFNRKRRNRNKLVSNAGSSLWTPLGECTWVSASGRQFMLRNTTLFNLCETERAALRQIIVQKLHELQLGCSITPPKDGSSSRRTWKQRLFIGRKDKDNNKDTKSFGIPLAQVIANDMEAEEACSRTGLNEHRAHSIVRQAEVVKEDYNEDNVSLTEESIDINNRRNSLPNSYVPLLRSSSFNLDEGEEIDFSDCENLPDNRERVDALPCRSNFQRNVGNRRRSRLLDALTLSSTSASYISIIDRDEELKPAPPQVPKIVLTLIDYIEKHGLNLLGIFRTGGLRKRVRHMREELDLGNTSIISSEETNPQDVAALFKEFFRDLPDPLLTRELYAAFLATRKLKEPDNQLLALQLLIGLLPVCSRDTLAALLSCLAKVASFAKDTTDEEGNVIQGNKMDSRNLATLIGPNILHKVKANSSAQNFSQEDSLRFAEENNKMIEVVKEMIENQSVLFKVSAALHDEVLRSLLDSDPEIVDYVLRKKASRVSQIEFPDDIKEELSRIPESTNAHPKRSMTFATSRRPKLPSRYSDEGSFVRNSLRVHKTPDSTQAARKVSNPERPGSIRSVMSTASEPDRFSYRRSNSSFHSYNAISSNRRSQSETAEPYLDNANDQINDSERYRASYRDSGVGMGRNSHRFSMEETRRKISALETVQPSLTPTVDESSTSSTPYSSPARTPILERNEIEDKPLVKLRDRDIRESRDSAYASGRFSRKGGTPFQGLQGIFALGEEELSPDVSVSSNSPTSPVFLSEVLDEPSFNNNNNDGKQMLPGSRKFSLQTELPNETQVTKKKALTSRAMSTLSDNSVDDRKLETKVRKAFLTWEEATWPHWDKDATKHEMPDQETIL